MNNQNVLDRVIRKNELCNLVGLSYSTIYRKIKDGSFPAPLRLGTNSVGWKLNDVQEWLENCEELGGEL